MNQYSEKSLKKLKVPELKQILIQYNTTADGKKEDLIARILQHGGQQSSSANALGQSTETQHQHNGSKISESGTSTNIQQNSEILDDRATELRTPTSGNPNKSIANEHTSRDSLEVGHGQGQKQNEQQLQENCDRKRKEIDITQINALDEKVRLSLRAKKFGEGGDLSVLDDEAKKLRRLQKFGTVSTISELTYSNASSETELKSNQKSKSPSAQDVNQAELLRKRALRFGLPLKTANEQHDASPANKNSSSQIDAELILKRKNKFNVSDSSSVSSNKGSVAMSEDEQDKLRKRAERFGLA